MKLPVVMMGITEEQGKSKPAQSQLRDGKSDRETDS